jgi:diacylglycerol kinase (ATP)
VLKSASLEPRLLATGAPGHATVLARQAIAEGADLVLVLGGDGTINEAANAMIHSGVPLGVLPAGTANVLAMELGLGSRMTQAIGRLTGAVERRVTVGRLVDARGAPRHFVSMGGVGLDATIVYHLNARLKEATGKLAYWLTGFSRVASRVGQFDACVDGKAYRCGFALVSRVRNYGGDLEIARGASLLAGDFEMVLFEGSNPLRYARYLLGVGTGRVQTMRGVHTLRGTCAEFSGDAHLQVDGEYAGRLPARFDAVPDALTLLVPPAYR